MHRILQLFNHWNKKTIHVFLSGVHKRHGDSHQIQTIRNHLSLVTRACNFQACGCKSHDLLKAARSHGCLTGEAAIFKLR